MTIDITNIINVSITNVPQGLAEPSVNSLALFTTETPSNVDEFRIYVTASEVANDYGTNSVTASMANTIFSQSPNILSGDGRLVIIPLTNSISAIAGDFVGTDISANLAAIQAVSNGDIRVVLNGNNIDLTDLDFTGATDFDDVAAILQKKLTDVIVTGKTTGFDLESKKVGAASTMDLVQLPAGSGTDLSVAGLFNVAAGVATAGGNAQGETLSDAITRTEESVAYVGVITDLEMEDAVISTTATTIQARDMVFVHQFSSTEDLEPTTGICSIIKDATQTKTRCLYYSVGNSSSNLMKTAYAGRAFSVNFAGSNTTQTMNLKALVGITPDNAITQTIYTKAEVAGADIYGDVSSLPIVISNGANDYFDNVYNSIWLKFALEVAGFNYLKQTNTKIPQTESGMDGLKGAYGKVCDRGVNNAMIGTGLEWNSPETFGNTDDLRRNITDTGYYIYSQPIAQQPQVDRDARKAPLVQIAVKLAGAIHSSTVLVVIER
jgi:hypothetical protein